MTAIDNQTRTSDSGTLYPADAIQEFLHRALEHYVLIEGVHELMLKHVIGGRYHFSVVTNPLQEMVKDVLSAATRDDWETITQELIEDARESLVVDEPVDR